MQKVGISYILIFDLLFSNLVARTQGRVTRNSLSCGSVLETARSSSSVAPVDPAEVLSRWENDNLGKSDFVSRVLDQF